MGCVHKQKQFDNYVSECKLFFKIKTFAAVTNQYNLGVFAINQKYQFLTS